MKEWTKNSLKRNSGLITHHYVFDASIIGAALLLAIVLGGCWLRIQELRDQQSWLIARNSQLLFEVIDFESEIGFGGLIHNFKNAQLRPQEAFYLVSAEADLQEAFRTLERIDNLTTTAHASVDLSGIRETLDEYGRSIEILREHLGNDRTPAELDALVGVHDMDAVEDLTRLVETARKDLLVRIEGQAANIDRIGDFFCVVGALLTTLIFFLFRKRQIDTADMRETAGRHAAYLFDQIPENVLGLSEDRQIIFLNSKARQFLGLTGVVLPCAWPEQVKIRPKGSWTGDREDLLDLALSGKRIIEQPALLTGTGQVQAHKIRFSCQKVDEEYANPLHTIVVFMLESADTASSSDNVSEGILPLALG
jgi:PAS domain-containing protein